MKRPRDFSSQKPRKVPTQQLLEDLHSPVVGVVKSAAIGLRKRSSQLSEEQLQEATTRLNVIMLRKHPAFEFAARALAGFGTEESFGHIVRAFKHGDDENRKIAAFALSLTKNPEAFGHLANALISDPSAKVREQAAYSIADLDNVEAIPHLEKATNDKSEDVRITAIGALGTFGDTKRFPIHVNKKALEAVALKMADEKETKSVRFAAAMALRKFMHLDGARKAFSEFEKNARH
jgi:HEAT repeat protein